MNSFRAAIQSGKGLHSGDPQLHSKEGRGAEADDLSSVEVPRGETRTTNHRDNDRHRLDNQKATARFDGENHEVELINLSGGGAMIRADFAPRLWERIDLMFDEGAEIECAVRWLRGDRVGLEFAHETRIDCEADTRDALLLDVIRRSFPDIALPSAKNATATTQNGDALASTRRVERRHPLIWMGEIFFNHSNERVRLRNISESGALIESAVSYPKGAELLLDLGAGGQHFATVGWSCSDKAGLVFAKPFDLRLLGRAKPEVARGQWTRPGPTRECADQDNPWADEWQRQSLEDMREDLEGYLKR